MTEHTKTPWRAEGGSVYWDCPKPSGGTCPVLLFSHSHANAEFIVRAVNAHDALVEALREIAETGPINEYGTDDQLRLAGCVKIARTALAKAETGVQP